MIQQQAFIGHEKMLKGGLHSHSTRSDGVGTPEEVIRTYYEHNYDFMTLTDHRCYNLKSYAPELPITVLPGVEVDRMIEEGKGFRCFHTVCLGPSAEDGNPYTQDQVFSRGVVSGTQEYQLYLDEFHRNHNMTVFCHPQWSSTSASYILGLQGNFAMEIWNTGNAMECDMDTDAAYWDEVLGQGMKIWGVAVDDGHKMNQHCRGWVMVRAENNIPSILSALNSGAFYSSCGPEIYNFYVEGSKAVIECSDVEKIRLHCDGHPTKIIHRTGGSLTRGEFIFGQNWEGGYKYVRMSIVDSQGRKAWTNPIFLED